MFCPSCGTNNIATANFCTSCGSSLSMDSNYQQLAKDFGFSPYAGFWKRFIAYVIDLMITGIIGAIIGFSLGALLISDTAFLEHSYSDDALFNALGIVVTWLYFALMESSASQATLGKMLFGIKVTDINGQRISFGRASGRHFGKIISAILLCIGYLMAAFTAKKQALHDMMAGCLVVNK